MSRPLRIQYPDALGVSAAKITMIGILPRPPKALEGTPSDPLFAPDKFPFLQLFHNIFTFETFHLLTLEADSGLIHAGIQVVF